MSKMCSEQLKSEILEVINRWMLKNDDPVENAQTLTKDEIVKSLLDILKTYFGYEEKPVEKLPDNPCEEKMKVPIQMSVSNDSEEKLNDNSSSINLSQEICRDDQNLNSTANIGETLNPEEINNETINKAAISPVVFLKEKGRSGTFEIKSPNCTNDSASCETTKNKINENCVNSEKLKGFSKKLEKAQNDIYTLVTSASAVHREIIDLKMQFQKEINQLSSQKMARPKSPLLLETSTTSSLLQKSTMNQNPSSMTKTPRSAITLKRKSLSFSNGKDERRLPYFPTSTSNSPARRQSFVMRSTMSQNSKDVVPKNPKYAHVQSTIPKQTSTPKQVKK